MPARGRGVDRRVRVDGDRDARAARRPARGGGRRRPTRSRAAGRRRDRRAPCRGARAASRTVKPRGRGAPARGRGRCTCAPSRADAAARRAAPRSSRRGCASSARGVDDERRESAARRQRIVREHGTCADPGRGPPADRPRLVTPTSCPRRRSATSSIPAERWIEAPADAAGARRRPRDHARRLQAAHRPLPAVAGRARPTRADARYMAIAADDLDERWTFRLFPDGSGEGVAPGGIAHRASARGRKILRDASLRLTDPIRRQPFADAGSVRTTTAAGRTTILARSERISRSCRRRPRSTPGSTSRAAPACRRSRSPGHATTVVGVDLSTGDAARRAYRRAGVALPVRRARSACRSAPGRSTRRRAARACTGSTRTASSRSCTACCDPAAGSGCTTTTSSARWSDVPEFGDWSRDGARAVSAPAAQPAGR